MTTIGTKTVLITGGAGGIGRLMALKMAALGAGVAIWDIDEQALPAVVDELKAAGARDAQGFVCDVSDRDAVYRVAAETTAALGPVEILVNNAGVVNGKPLLEIADEQIERTIKINALALFWTAKAFLPAMVERGSGHIVTIASAGGLIGVPRQTDYGASKFAAFGFNEALRNELRRSAPGVTTTIVCPSYIDTGMFAGATTRFSLLLPILHEQAVADRVVKAIQLNRRQVLMPPLVRTVPLMRMLPVPVFDWIADFLGVTRSMDEFTGRTG
jgi:all-trans-retinol dehydrogenase (NAD+)